jgi:plasmid maintenance system killer protein
MEMEWRSERDRQAVEQLALRNAVTARRMERIKAAKDFRDLQHPANGRAHFLKDDLEGYFAIDLKTKTDPERLICQPTGEYKVRKGQFIKETITSIEIVGIKKDYHKK